CHFELDPIAQGIVLDSIRNAIPSVWREKVAELHALGDVSLATYLEQTELELEDVYSGNRGWSDLRRGAGLPTADPGPHETALLRAVGRLLHVDDEERLEAYSSFVASAEPPTLNLREERSLRYVRMLTASLTNRGARAAFDEAVAELWAHPQVRAEL